MDLLIIFGAKYLFIVIGILAIIKILFSPKDLKVSYIKLAIFTLPLSLIIAKIGNLIIFSPRPFVVERITPLIHASADNGFPSDHTLLSLTIASIVFAYNKKTGAILLLFGLLVGVSRVLAHAHHWVDVIGSLFIAVIATYISSYLVKKIKYKLPYLES
ncbi:hypothetical protein BH11PAT1_BH11PAT1_6970 [soil metagenome]